MLVWFDLCRRSDSSLVTTCDSTRYLSFHGLWRCRAPFFLTESMYFFFLPMSTDAVGVVTRSLLMMWSVSSCWWWGFSCWCRWWCFFPFPMTTIFPSSNYTTFLLTTSCRPSLCLALDIRCSILIACITLALIVWECCCRCWQDGSRFT